MPEPRRPSLRDTSPFTDFVRRLFDWAKLLSPMKWLSRWVPVLRPRSSLSQDEIRDLDFVRRRGIAIDLYLWCWFLLIGVLAAVLSYTDVLPSVRIAIAVIVVLRLLEIFQVTINLALFDALTGRPDELVSSRARLIVLAVLNYCELMVLFGMLYAMDYQKLVAQGMPTKHPLNAFYFSAITQLTIGYGDVSPTGWLRVLAVAQGLSAFLFVFLILGRFVASLSQMKVLSEHEGQKSA